MKEILVVLGMVSAVIGAFITLPAVTSCSDSSSVSADSNDWDCSESTTTAHEAFIDCVRSMSTSAILSEKGQVYDASQCEDYAHRNFCVSKKAKENAQLKQAQAETKRVRTELTKAKKLADKFHKQRNIFCAALMGECIMYGVETKTDRHCEDACVIGDEDVSKEVDAEIKAEKEDP